MTQLKIIGAAAILTAALASPAVAQQVIGTAARCSSAYPDANCQTMRRDAYHHRAYRRDRDWQESNNRYDPGPFAPVDAAADVVGGAVGTAAAIATAPFGGPGYPSGGYYARGSAEYAQQNGFVCTPGTWFKGDDGLRHPCQ